LGDNELRLSKNIAQLVGSLEPVEKDKITRTLIPLENRNNGLIVGLSFWNYAVLSSLIYKDHGKIWLAFFH